MHRSILGFDTSAINALHKGGQGTEPLLARLSEGYAIRLNGTALDEIVAHSTAEERERLRKLCRKLLQNGIGDVLLPFHEITTRLAVAFENEREFDWTRIDVRSSEYMGFIFGDEIDAMFDQDYETISSEQRASAAEVGDQFEQVFLTPRPIFQKLREGRGEGSWPKSAAELAVVLQGAGGAYWNYATGLYERATGKSVTEEKIRKFISECPPFRALLAAFIVAQYDRSICEDPQPRLAGRNDMLMAMYLPYCHEFISNDHAQQKALRQVVSIAGLQTSVRWHKEFFAKLETRESHCVSAMISGARSTRTKPSG